MSAWDPLRRREDFLLAAQTLGYQATSNLLTNRDPTGKGNNIYELNQKLCKICKHLLHFSVNLARTATSS